MTRYPRWPDPGIYNDIPFPQYLALKAVNSTLLRDLTTGTPKRAHYFRESGKEPSAAMQLGSAVNHRLLEQGDCFGTIAIWRERKSNGHMMPRKGAKWDTFEAANRGRLIINETVWDEAGYVAAGFRRNPVARELMARRQGTEVTILWLRDGRLCKARIDILLKDWSFADLKVCGVSLAKDKFAWHAWGYRWDMQAAWYQEALLAHDKDCQRAYIVPVEAKQPHDCIVYRWPDGSTEAPGDALDRAHEANGEAFQRLQECEESGSWPGYGDHAVLNAGPWKDDDGSHLGGPKVDFGDIP
jgi:hypothetical protein